MFHAKYENVTNSSRLNIRRRQGNSSVGHSTRRSPNTTYDLESGQVYSEKVVRMFHTPRQDWIKQCKTPRLPKPRETNKEGAASLLEMTVSKVVREMDNLTASHIEWLPLSVGRLIWDEVQKSQRDSLHAWCILATAFREIFQSPHQRYFIDIRELFLPPSEFFSGLDSESVTWLTCLRINPSSIDQSDLVRIGQLRSLVVLDLSDDSLIARPESQIDERILKSWTEMAAEGSFQSLRVILMRGQTHVSAWIFKYLQHFPALCFVVFTDCRSIHQRNRNQWADEAARCGWEARHGKRSARSLKDLIDDKEFHTGAVSRCYYHTEEILQELATEQEAKLRDPLPILEAWVGNPKPWFHLIEEFPGTRTVWFDNTNPQAAPYGRPRTPKTQVHNKRRRDVLSSPDSSTKQPPQKSTTMMARQSRNSLGQILADLG